MSPTKKKKVLFVGSFAKSSKDGSTGGLNFASRSLIESSLSEHVEWRLIDSTTPTVPSPNMRIRFLLAVIRVFLFLFYTVFHRPDYTLIFVGNGYSFLEKGLMCIWAKALRIPILLAPRSGYIVKDLKSSRRMRWYVHTVFSISDKVICQGEKWRDLFVSFPGVKEKQLVVIKNWLDTSRYEKNVFSLDRVPINILFMGWIEEAKGVFDLVDAVRPLCSGKTRPFIVHFAGDGRVTARLREKIVKENLTRVCLLEGWVTGEKKSTLLSQTDIFVLPTKFEGFPNALLEAMACGIPSISTRVGGIPDLIVDGDNGLLIEAGDVAALSEKLALLLSDADLRKKLGDSAYATVQKNHTVESAAEKMKKILEIEA